MLRKLTFSLAIFAVLLAACAPAVTPTLAPAATEIPATSAPTLEPTLDPTAAPAGLTFTDGLGREVKLAGPAQRIVSLAPSNTEILFAVGAVSGTVLSFELGLLWPGFMAHA